MAATVQMDKCADGKQSKGKQRHVHLYGNSVKISLFMNVHGVIGVFVKFYYYFDEKCQGVAGRGGGEERSDRMKKKSESKLF